MYTINEIAEKIGVSRSTISRVINDSKDVNPKTRAKILEAIELYGYVPNLIARSLKTKTKMIGVITQDVLNPYYTQVLFFVEKQAREKGYCLIHLNSDNSAELEKQNIIQILSLKAQGVLFIANILDHRNKFMKMCIETTQVVAIDGNIEGASSVSSDCSKGIQQAVDYATKMGHTKVAICHNSVDSYPIQARIKSFKESFKDKNLIIQEKYYIFQHDYIAKLQSLKNKNDLPTIIFALTDSVAHRIYKWAKDENLCVGKDFSIISFDGVAISELLSPPLTTITQPIEKIVAHATQILINNIENKQNSKEKIQYPTNLVIRNSVRLCK